MPLRSSFCCLVIVQPHVPENRVSPLAKRAGRHGLIILPMEGEYPANLDAERVPERSGSILAVHWLVTSGLSCRPPMTQRIEGERRRRRSRRKRLQQSRVKRIGETRIATRSERTSKLQYELVNSRSARKIRRVVRSRAGVGLGTKILILVLKQGCRLG